MGEMRHRWPEIEKQNEEQRAARMRMALFPEKAEVLYTDSEIWVVCTVHQPRWLRIVTQVYLQPVVRLEGKLCVFPGIPRLFQKMLDGLKPYLPLPPPSERPFRQQIFTTYEATGI